MTVIVSRLLLAAATSLVVLAGPADAESNRVTFPPDLDKLVHYTTVTRGNVTEHMLTTREAIEAVKAGKPIPDGTHVVLADYRGKDIYRYFIMEKGAGWGAESGNRTGDWQFQWFKPDRTINMNETTSRCQSCHEGRASTDFLYTHRDLLSAK